MTPRVKGAVILGGGASRRMGGGDKCLKDLGGKPLLQRVLERIKPQVPRLLINAGGDRSRFADFAIEVRADCLLGGLGPLAGILTALKWLDEVEADGYLLSVPCDAPFLPTDLAARLLDEVGERKIAVAASLGRRHPVCGLWHPSLVGELEVALKDGVRKIEDFTAAYEPKIIDFAAADYDPFLNLNRPNDLTLAERLLAANEVADE